MLVCSQHFGLYLSLKGPDVIPGQPRNDGSVPGWSNSDLYSQKLGSVIRPTPIPVGAASLFADVGGRTVARGHFKVPKMLKIHVLNF